MRSQITDQLFSHFQSVSAGDGSKLVVLQGNPGVGKTFAVQQFYKKLAASQEDPKYWPDSIVEDLTFDASFEAVTKGRKLIRPNFSSIDESTSLEWMWWGIGCSQQDRFQVLEKAADQLFAHGGNILLSRKIRESGKTSVDVASALVGVLGILGISVAPPIGISLTVASAARLGWDRRDLLGRVKDFRNFKLHRSPDESAHEYQSRIDKELGELLAKISEHVPLVIVLDDAHWAHGRTLAAIDQVLRLKKSRVLIIATSWPHQLNWKDVGVANGDQESGFSTWFDEFEANFPGRTDVIEIEAMTVNELSEVFPGELSALSGDDAKKLVDLVSGNPLVLRGVLGFEALRQQLLSGHLNWDQMSIPDDVVGMFRLYWSEFPIAVKKALSIGAVMGSEFVPQVVEAVLSTTADSSLPALKMGRDASWLRAVSEFLDEFGEPILHSITERDSRNYLMPQDKVVIRQVFSEHFGTLKSQLEGRALARLREIDVKFALDTEVEYPRNLLGPFTYNAEGSPFHSAFELVEERWAVGDLNSAREFAEACLIMRGVDHWHSGVAAAPSKEESEFFNLYLAHSHMHWEDERIRLRLAEILLDMDRLDDAASVYQWLASAKEAQFSLDSPVGLLSKVGLLGVYLKTEDIESFESGKSDFITAATSSRLAKQADIPGCTHCKRALQLSAAIGGLVTRLINGITPSESDSSSDRSSQVLAIAVARSQLEICAQNSSSALNILRRYRTMAESSQLTKDQNAAECLRLLAIYSNDAGEKSALWKSLADCQIDAAEPGGIWRQARFHHLLGLGELNKNEALTYLQSQSAPLGDFELVERSQVLEEFSSSLTNADIEDIWESTMLHLKENLAGNGSAVERFLRTFTKVTIERSGSLNLYWEPLGGLIESPWFDARLALAVSSCVRSFDMQDHYEITDSLQESLLSRSEDLDDMWEREFGILLSDRGYTLKSRKDTRYYPAAQEIFQRLLDGREGFELTENDVEQFQNAIDSMS